MPPPPDPVTLGAGGYAFVRLLARWTRRSHPPCQLVVSPERNLPWAKNFAVHTTMDGRIEIKLIGLTPDKTTEQPSGTPPKGAH